ncbi:MFS transporter [Tessaracoccus caeni]|uniref:MFS transporter n=1 Tax=Tessaracoccus caeni TaxID=3031239 RepID=UPI0023DBE1DB|nr:MFS transporter [Tessaracoccus caeni]MDF1489639.1 MFS transporter [Tessaracoccus caeni]
MTGTSSPEARPGSTATLVLASLGFFLITLDVSIVNLALPSIRADLGGGVSTQQWILDGYTLFFAAFLLCFGNLSDRVGAKRAYVSGIALFGVTSLLCALAPSVLALIVARCAQGVAAALMLPASMTLIREAFPDARRRAKALGVWAAGGAVASAAGPVLGGTLSAWDWSLIFAINVPVCIAMMLLAVRVQRSPQNNAAFDWAGQILALIALGTIIFALIEGGAIGYGNPLIVVLLVVGVTALVLFIFVQARVAHPMMPLQLFRRRPMRVAFFGGFTFIYAWFGSVFLSSLYLQQHLEIPSSLAGLVFLPSALLSLFGNIASGPLANRFGPRFPVILGMSSLVIGLVGLALSTQVGSATLVGIMLILIGGGGSVAMPPLAGIVLEHSPDGQAGVASAVSNTFRQVGGALAVAVFGVLVTPETRFLEGMQLSLSTAAVLALICVISSTTLAGTRHGA